MADAAPNMARLSASVPPEVKNTSSLSQCQIRANIPAASRTSFSASKPKECMELGFPYSLFISVRALSAASSITMVVAELSRYIMLMFSFFTRSLPARGILYKTYGNNSTIIQENMESCKVQKRNHFTKKRFFDIIYRLRPAAVFREGIVDRSGFDEIRQCKKLLWKV